MTDTPDNNDKKRKPATDTATTLRTDNMTSGEILRAAREKKKLSVEDVSAAIHVRASQIRAIEEGNIDALPGMTYAVGFVKSYAGYLKLNAIELGNKFKAEHGALKPLMPDLPEPKPIVESRMPDPTLVGIAGFCALVLLLGWAFFSGGDETQDLALTDAVVAEGAMVPPVDNVTDEVTGETTAAGEAETAATEATSEEAPAPAETVEVEAVDAEPATTPEAAALTEAAAPAPEEAETAEPLMPAKKPELPEVTAAPAAEVAAPEEPITIRKNGRVVFKARQASWIQVSDANERVVFKRLLKAGEQYTVPDGSGYTLITTNAGGVDVIVDGKQAPALGKKGEILRGLPLEPDALMKEKRIKSRMND